MEKQPAWLFDESKQVGVDYTNEGLVSDYDKQHEGFRDFASEAKRIAEDLGLSARSTVLDMGCGTGGLATHLAQICKHVYAADVSGPMIGKLREKVERQGLRNVTAVQAGFLTYDHVGNELDAAVVNIALHHLPDFWKQVALCRLHDLLRQGGKLFIVDVVFGFSPREFRSSIDDWLQSMEKMAGKEMAAETVVHVRDEYSTWEWVMRGMIERAGFTVERDEEFRPNMRAYVCSRK
jgi:ubiquinone/menaquinone biosynthesis C-methylase UbiE